jgi:pimeloyl-ACP methyl ester carboxylesterase
MRRPVLHFSHANGFPAATYRSMLGLLEATYRINTIAAIGMDPRHPPTEGWPHLTRHVIENVERGSERQSGQPVIGVGHSLGGYLTFMAAVARPDLFSAIVLLDAPIIGAIKGRLLGATKRFGIVDRVTPAGATRERRSEWGSLAEAERHFHGKPLFRRFAPEALRDYVRYGLVDEGSKLRLLIDPAIEYEIYRTVPHDLHRLLPRLKVPAGFIGGADSDVVRRVGLSTMRRAGFAFRRVQGGHLFPLEHPAAAAKAIQEMAARLGAC